MSVQKAFEQAVRLLPENPVVVEIGAHAGDGVRYMLSKRPKAKIYAIEPCKKSFKKLVGFHENSYNIAITDGRGEKCLAKSGNHRQYRIVDKQSELFHATLDDFLFGKEIEWVDLLRFDCYGSEYSIFRSNNRFLSITDMVCVTLHKQQVCECDVKSERNNVRSCLRDFDRVAKYGKGPMKHSFELWRKK